MPARLLEQDRQLDRSEAEPTLVFTDGDAEPAEVDHRGPQIGVPSRGRRVHGADPGRRTLFVEELARGVAQRDLVRGEVEIHQWRTLLRNPTTQRETPVGCERRPSNAEEPL